MEMDEFGDADTEASLDGDRALIMAADARVGGGRVSVKETRRVARHPLVIRMMPRGMSWVREGSNHLPHKQRPLSERKLGRALIV
jgi:hypothetical protein